MTLKLDIESATRKYMLAELDRDEENSGPYLSVRLSPEGVRVYAQLLRDALSNGSDETLEAALSRPRIFNPTEAYGPGKTKTRKMNTKAPQILAEGEFNRFYIRGLCAQICAEGGGEVEVYRARESSWARPESEALIGTCIDATRLLEDLREHTGEPPDLLPEVNSGLSVRRVN